MSAILIIDDDTAVRRLFWHILTHAGYEVLEARDGRAGLASCEARRIDVVLVDLFLPEEDGFALLRTLRTLIPPVKILALSGGGHRAEQDVLAMARQFGVDGTLQKPVQRATLLAAVQAVLAEP